MGKYFGIDLGTTYSCIATVQEGATKVFNNYEGEPTTPSVIDLKEDGSYSVGSTAKEDILSDGVLVEEIKRYMGDPDYSIEVGGNKYTPVALSALILKKLKEDVENQGETIEGVTITCPAYFGQIERQNTRAAGIAAGLNVLSVINEPTAAAYSYVMNKLTIGDKKVALVYDLGGGTFDVTLLEVEVVAKEDGSPKRIVKVITSDGNATLGGKDWDHRLMDKIIEKACDQLACTTEDITDDIETYKDITRKAEIAKKKLSTTQVQKINIQATNGNCKVEVTAEEFENLTQDLLDTTITLTNNVLDTLIAQGKKLDEVLLVGGSTRMPQVKRALEANQKLIGVMDQVVITMHDPDQAVASGAALWAETMGTESEEQTTGGSSTSTNPPIPDPNNQTTGESSSSTGLSNKPGSSIVVEEKLTKSYGLVILANDNVTEIVSNIIFKDTPYDPRQGIVNKNQYGTVIDNQKSISFRIMENTSTDAETTVESSTELYNFDFALPAGAPRGTAIDVEYFFDPSAILHISVKEGYTNTTCDNQQVQIKGVVSEEEALITQQMLNGLKRND